MPHHNIIRLIQRPRNQLTTCSKHFLLPVHSHFHINSIIKNYCSTLVGVNTLGDSYLVPVCLLHTAHRESLAIEVSIQVQILGEKIAVSMILHMSLDYELAKSTNIFSTIKSKAYLPTNSPFFDNCLLYF